jgi:hypothetical protein
MSIAETNFNDDEYNYDASAQEQSGPRELLLMPGVYEVTAQLMERTTKDGDKVVSTDNNGNEWPVYVMPAIEVTNPQEESGRFTVCHEVRTRPYRFNENEKFISDGAVLLKGIDAEAAQTATTFGEAVKALDEKANGGPVNFLVSTGLTGRDSDWARQQIKDQNLDENDPTDKKKIQQIWKKANLPTKAFMVQKGTKTSPAVYGTSCIGPSGKKVEAKVKISRILAQGTEGVELGAGKFPPR